ncbi:MAG: glutaredoxin 3 [Gammaproteobacteria bacterium]
MANDDKLTRPEVMMYTQALCGYCSAARKLLKSKGVDFEEVDVTLSAKRRREMIDRSGRHTVPQIFAGERHLGGYDDIAELDRQDRLDKLLGLDA